LVRACALHFLPVGDVDPKTGALTCNTPFSLSAWIVVYSAAEAVLSQVCRGSCTPQGRMYAVILV